MRMSNGGYRAAVLETITAAERGEFADKLIYAVEFLPGPFRRVKTPKESDTFSVGVLPCWCDGGIVYLTPAVALADELKFLEPQPGSDGLALVNELQQKRTDYTIRERASEQEAGEEAPEPNSEPVGSVEPEPGEQPEI